MLKQSSFSEMIQINKEKELIEINKEIIELPPNEVMKAGSY